MNCSRRLFLKTLGGLSSAFALGHISKLVFADAYAQGTAAEPDILVVIFLRGGYDGLNLLGPADDRSYAAARGGDLKVTERGSNAGLPLNNAFAGNDFRLHPMAKPLKELYDSGVLAFIHACGLTNGTRSHFDAQSLIERGTATDNTKHITTGWLTRYLNSANPNTFLPVVATSATSPDALMGYLNAVAITDINGFRLQGHATYGPMQQALLRNFYQGDSKLSQVALKTLDTIDYIDTKIPRDKDGNLLAYQPEQGVTYPADGYSLTTSLQVVANLIKMDIGLRVATVDFDGWDTHEYQANVFPTLINSLSTALAAFYNDLSRFHNRLTLVVLSEFGRRLKQNESGGSDHGHGNVMMVLGGNVNGGQLYGRWPGLATAQLDQGVDLAVTTDYRDVLSEIVVRRLGNPNLNVVFPGLSAYNPLNIVRGDDGNVTL